jgi:protein TonB
MDDRSKNIPDFDDLLFELRNKDYGAYQLRKRYNSVVVAGIIVSSLLFSSIIILPFILRHKSDRLISGGFHYVQVQMENLEPPKEEIIVPPSPPPPEAPRVQEVVKYTPPEVVDTILPLEIQQAATDVLLSQTSTDQIEVAGTGNGDDLFDGEYGEDTNEPFFMVEVMPSFKGGDINKFRDWVLLRTNYPQVAIDNKIQGRVFLTFIVETDGTVSNVTVYKGVDPIIDNEAIKTIESSPKWSPGLQRGRPVRVRFQMSLNFVF